MGRMSLWLVLVVAGCDVQIEDGQFACTSHAACPDGFGGMVNEEP